MKQLDCYTLKLKVWIKTILLFQENLRYFHVSLIVDEAMIVTGGYTGDAIQDFADQPLVYDLRCGSWHKPDLTGIVRSLLNFSFVCIFRDDK